MVEESSFTTRARPLTSNGALGWGGQRAWADDVDVSDGVSFADGVARPGQTVPDSGIARYPLTEDATDVWGEHHGTSNGVTFVDDAELGGVAAFDGSSEITLPRLGFTGDTSISVALRYYVAPDAPTTNNFFGFGTDGTESTTFSIRTRSDGGYRYYFWSNDLDVNVSNYYGAWSSVVITYDASASDRRLYHNGAFVDSDTPADPSFNNEKYSIGGFNDEYHHGRMSNVQVFSRALTATEASNYHATGSINGRP